MSSILNQHKKEKEKLNAKYLEKFKNYIIKNFTHSPIERMTIDFVHTKENNAVSAVIKISQSNNDNSALIDLDSIDFENPTDKDKSFFEYRKELESLMKDIKENVISYQEIFSSNNGKMDIYIASKKQHKLNF